MELILTDYIYHNVFAQKKQTVRVYSEKEGANGRVALEDIVEILLTDIELISSNKFANKSDYNISTITQDKIQLANIAPIEHEGLHLADVEQLHEFYSFCDDLAAEELYENVGDWLNYQVCSLIIKRIAYLGKMVSQIPFWEEYALKVGKLFDENEKITIRDWLIKSYGLTVSWVILILTNKVKQMMSSGYTVNAGEKPIKNEEKVNIYYPKTYGFVAQRIDWWLSKDNWLWFYKEINGSVAAKQKISEDKKQVKALKKQGKKVEDIINIIWQVTPTSNLVEDKNYQYDILKAFVEMV